MLNITDASGCHGRFVCPCIARQEQWQQAAGGTQNVHHLSPRVVNHQVNRLLVVRTHGPSVPGALWMQTDRNMGQRARNHVTTR
jgi:hypothetical protein